MRFLATTSLFAVLLVGPLATCQQKDGPKKLTETDLKLDFSLFEKLGLKVQDFTLEDSGKIAPKGGPDSATICQMTFLVRFEKNLTPNELKDVVATCRYPRLLFRVANQHHGHQIR